MKQLGNISKSDARKIPNFESKEMKHLENALKNDVLIPNFEKGKKSVGRKDALLFGFIFPGCFIGKLPSEDVMIRGS